MDAPHGYYANGNATGYPMYGYGGYAQQPPGAIPPQTATASVANTSTPPTTAGDGPVTKKRKAGGKRASKASVASMSDLDQGMRSGYQVTTDPRGSDRPGTEYSSGGSGNPISAASQPTGMAAPAYNDPFANVTRGLDDAHKQELSNYWQATISDMEENEHDFKSHSLPLARIKKVMKSDEEVKMISAEAPVLFAKGCEIFITELTMRAWIHAEQNKRRTLQRSDIANAIGRSDMFDFLIDIVPREEFVANRIDDAAAAAAAVGGVNTAGTTASGSAQSNAAGDETPKSAQQSQVYSSMAIGNGHDPTTGMAHAMYPNVYGAGPGGPGAPQQPGAHPGHDPMYDPRTQFMHRPLPPPHMQPGQVGQPGQQAPQPGQQHRGGMPPAYPGYGHPYYMDPMYGQYVNPGVPQQQQQQQQPPQSQGGGDGHGGDPTGNSQQPGGHLQHHHGHDGGQIQAAAGHHHQAGASDWRR